MGFVKGEMAGIWVKVPDAVEYFVVDYFRVVVGSTQKDLELDENVLQVFFRMQVADRPRIVVGSGIETAAEIRPGNHWNDIPAKGLDGGLGCISGGQSWNLRIQACLAFTEILMA